MHRCPVPPTAADLPLHGRELAGPVVTAGGVAVTVAFVAAATGLLRVGAGGVPGVAAAGAVALLLAVVALRPTRSCCSVRRAVIGALTQVTCAALLWLALG